MNQLLRYIRYPVTIMLLLTLLTCTGKNPVDSKTAFETVTITPTGGVFTFEGGVTLTVPPYAVPADTDIEFRVAARKELRSYYSRRGMSEDRLLVCVEGKPDGFTFDVPVTVSVQAGLAGGEIPLVGRVDTETGDWSPLITETLVNPQTDSLQFTLSHFSTASAEISRELSDLIAEQGGDPCRKGRILVEQSDKDLVCDDGDCQVSESKLTVTFLDCPGQPQEESYYREISAGCTPSMTLSSASPKIGTGGQTSVTAEIELGCGEKAPGQTVTFSTSGAPGGVDPSNAVTDSQGLAVSVFTAGDEEGTATVTARSEVSYPSFTVSASAGGVTETENGPMRTADLRKNIAIQIEEPDEAWSGTMSYDHTYEFIDAWGLGWRSQEHYDVEFSFIVVDGDSIFGTAIASQTVSVEFTTPGLFEAEITSAPGTLNLLVRGQKWLNDLIFKLPGDAPFYTWASYCIIPGMPRDYQEHDGWDNLLLHGGDYFDPGFFITEGTYTGGYSILDGLSVVSYTITLEKQNE